MKLFKLDLTLLEHSQVLVIDVETKLLTPSKRSLMVDPPDFILGAAYESPLNRVFTERKEFKNFLLGIKERTFVVGHNISFDLITIFQTPSELFKFLSMPYVWLWDTMLGTYLYSGQSETFPSLERSGGIFGIPARKDELGERIKEGVCPSTMDKEALARYCMQDVKITQVLFNIQVATARSNNMITTYFHRMEWLRNTLLASAAGLYVDAPELRAETMALDTDVRLLEIELVRIMTEAFMKHIPSTFDLTAVELDFEVSPNSPKQIATLLYGNNTFDIKVASVSRDLYKSGPKKGSPKIKYAIESIRPLAFLTSPSFLADTSAKALEYFRDNAIPFPHLPASFADTLLKYRDMKKTLSTSFIPTLEHAKTTGKTHTTYTHVATPTGRLTSKHPNVQNLK